MPCAIRSFPGRVVRLSPRMDRKTVWSDRATERYDTKTREVWIELQPGPPLVLGLRVDVTIDLETLPKPQPTSSSKEKLTSRQLRNNRHRFPAKPS